MTEKYEPYPLYTGKEKKMPMKKRHPKGCTCKACKGK